MIVPDRKMSWFRLLFEVRGSALPRIRGRLLAVFLVACAVTALYELAGKHVDFTTVPFTLIGFALGVFLGFRNNTAYDRYWEGRRLWGRLVNDTRSFARLVLTVIDVDATPKRESDGAAVAELKRAMLYRMIGYVHALRLSLRNELSDLHELEPYLGDVGPLRIERNVPNAILHGLSEQIQVARKKGWLSNRDVHLLENLLTDVTDVQGGCERIRATPMPWSYTVLIHSIVATYCFTLPFGLVATTHLSTPIVVVLIAYAFLGLDAVGDEIEEPFGTDLNDLPLTTLARMIEVNLRQRLGESDLPPLIEPDASRVLP